MINKVVVINRSAYFHLKRQCLVLCRNAIYFILPKVFGQNRTYEKLIRKFLSPESQSRTTFSHVVSFNRKSAANMNN